MMMKAWIWSAILIPTAPTNLSYQHLWKIWYWYAINQVKGPNDAKTVAEKKEKGLSSFSLHYLNAFFLFFKSCTHFLYPTHFMFAIIFWSSFCFFFSFSFLIYIFQLKIQHNWESVFWWGKLVLVKPTYLIFFFLMKISLYLFSRKWKHQKVLFSFCIQILFFLIENENWMQIWS